MSILDQYPLERRDHYHWHLRRRSKVCLNNIPTLTYKADFRNRTVPCTVFHGTEYGWVFTEPYSVPYWYGMEYGTARK